jgi:chaperonin GroES
MTNVPDGFQPAADRLLILPETVGGEKTHGSLIIPDMGKEKPQRGEVIAVGPGKPNDQGVTVPVPFGVGEIVMFGKFSGTLLTFDGREYLLMRESDILGTVVTEDTPF